LGETDFTNEGQYNFYEEVSGDYYFPHPDYDATTKENNIGLIQLSLTFGPSNDDCNFLHIEYNDYFMGNFFSFYH
jgi:hypothetical protein